MGAYGLVLTIVVLLFVALLILLYERKRAKGIERDLGAMADERRRDGHRPEGR